MTDSFRTRSRRAERAIVVVRWPLAIAALLHLVAVREPVVGSSLGMLAIAGAGLLLLVAIGSTIALRRAGDSPRALRRIARVSLPLDAAATLALATGLSAAYLEQFAGIQVAATGVGAVAWAFVAWPVFTASLRDGARNAAWWAGGMLLAAGATTMLVVLEAGSGMSPWREALAAMLPAGLAAGGALAMAAMHGDSLVDVERQLASERARISELRAAEEAKNTVLSAVSHELRTPLTSLLGIAATLEQRDGQLREDDRVAMLGAMVSEAEHLDELLANLLDLDRLTRGKAVLVRGDVDAAVLVRRAVKMICDRSGREVEIDAPETLAAHIDAPKVERIVANLVGNAAKYSPGGSHIGVHLRSVDDVLVIRVDDAGPGIPDHLRAEVFEAFTRGEVHGAPGSGVGLALVAHFARMHGGSARVDESPGGGARMVVLLPGSVACEPERVGAAADAADRFVQDIDDMVPVGVRRARAAARELYDLFRSRANEGQERHGT